MGKKVFANGLEISGKASDHMCIAAMPDVCLSPPSPPAGPIPIPYPNTSKSKDLKDGSKSVKIGDEPVCLGSKSHYKSSPLGDEASTKTFGANVIDHGNAGNTHCQAFSMDVTVEDEPVTRTGDLTTSNHTGTQPPGGATTSQVAGVTPPPSTEDESKCPCCDNPRHSNQKSADGTTNLRKISEEDFYKQKAAKARGSIAADAEIALFLLKEARAHRPPCPNLHNPPDEGCGTHFDKTEGPKTADVKTDNNWATVRTDYIADAATRGFNVPSNTKVNHMTAVSAGGCPSDFKNLKLDIEFPDTECVDAESAQTLLQGLN